MTKDAIREACAVALESVAKILPGDQLREAHAWIHEYGEWGLAIECVIDWIGDLDLPVDKVQFDAIERAMSAMGWGESPRMVWLRGFMSTRQKEAT